MSCVGIGLGSYLGRSSQHPLARSPHHYLILIPTKLKGGLFGKFKANAQVEALDNQPVVRAAADPIDGFLESGIEEFPEIELAK